MKDFVLKVRGALLVVVIALAAMLPSDGALAQVVTKLPVFVAPASVVDLGNGPQELRTLLGNAWGFTSQGSGVGSTSGSSTTLALTSTAVAVPCVGCIISGPGITSGTTVAAFNGVTNITLSAAMTIPSASALAWGAACPVFSSAVQATPQMALQIGGDIPLYTQARLCAYANNGPGAQLLPFAIGAH